MQNIHSIGGSGGGGDRRLRLHHNQLTIDPLALKCPRCDSSNTKFCYYNNYNLSQPRHFCKSCRRYWTIGGVLRNVPVGGGCRKKKRSKPKSGNRNPCSVRNPSNSQSFSSSDSSSLTATATTTTATTTATAPLAAAADASRTSATTSFHFHGVSNPSFDLPLPDQISPEINVLTGLMTSSAAHLTPEFDISAGISPFRLHHTGKIVENSNTEQEQWMIADQTKPAEFSGLPEKMTGGGLGTVDWNSCTDQALFDLTGTVDESYWNQSQWDDGDHDHDHDSDYPRHRDHDSDYPRDHDDNYLG